MRKTCYMLAIILFGILIQSSTLSQETTLALEEYKQIAEENRNYRTYGAKSGLRGNSRYQFSDADGYRWYLSSDDGTKIYLFNGVRYTDVISADKAAVRDTLLNTLLLSKTSQTVYAAGRRNLYRWKGYFWEKYTFPQHDKIIRMLGYDDDIYCLGEHGLGSLKNGVWGYQAFKGMITESEAAQASIGKDGAVYFLSMTNLLEATVRSGQSSSAKVPILTNINDLYLKRFSSEKTSSLLVASGKTIFKNYYSDEYKIPQTLYEYSRGLLWIWVANTDLLYKYDLHQKRLHKIALDPGISIQSVMRTDIGSSWLIAKNSGWVEAAELLPDFPAKKGRFYHSPALILRDDYLDFLNLDGQLLPLAVPYRKKYSDKYSLIRILEPDVKTGTFTVIDLVNPYQGSSCRQIYNMRNLLLLDMEHDKFKDVSRVLILRYPNKQITKREILIDSETYSLAYNRPMDSIIFQRNGAVTVIPLEIICEQVYQAPYQQKHENFLHITKLKGNRLVSIRGLGEMTSQLSIFRLKAGHLEPLANVRNGGVTGVDEDAGLVYIRSQSLEKENRHDEISSYDLKQGKINHMEGADVSARFYPFSGGYHIFDGERGKTVMYAKSKQAPAITGETRPLLAFQKNFMRALRSDNITKWQGRDKGKTLTGALLDIVDYSVLDHQWMGAGYRIISLSHQETKSNPGLESNRFPISDLPDAVNFRNTDGRSLYLPTHIYNLQEDQMYPKPMWVKFYPPFHKKHYIGHLEKLSPGKYRYRVSLFSAGKLELHTDDFMLNVADEFVPAVTAYYSESGQMYGDDDHLYYRHQNTWQNLDMRQYEMYGRLNNVTVLNKVFWLCFPKALLRFDPEKKISYTYTSKEGIPDEMEEIFAEDGKLMLKTWDSIYAFNEYKNKLKLDIPYIIVSDSLHVRSTGKVKLPYTQRRLEIPVSILGPMYPELCRITYRLRGFTDDWVTKDYMEKIRYDKLPYGSYTFEVSAMAANGDQTPVRSISIRITPPFYYAWYAFVFYALALLGLIFAIVRWRIYRYRQINHQLEAQVALRTHELQEWQLRMTQSIEYALLIQKSILPQTDQMHRIWKDYFILWLPRDIVGGDFYWLHELPGTQSVLFAVIDCTGHGVPGALVSMTVNAALNHIVTEHGIDTPDIILQQLHEDVGLTLHQESERTQQDGLDISMIKVNFAENTLSFAGAALDMIIYDPESHEMQTLKGSKVSIGGLKHRKNHTFDLQQVTYTQGSRIYLYTDGILDQPNEMQTRTKRLGPEQWFKIINEIGDQPMSDQKTRLEDKIRQMLLLDNQRDDITIVGLQV